MAPRLRAQDLSGVGAGRVAVLNGYFAVDDRVVNTGGFLDHPGFVTRQILNVLGFQGINCRRIEDGEIGGEAGPD